MKMTNRQKDRKSWNRHELGQTKLVIENLGKQHWNTKSSPKSLTKARRRFIISV